MTKYKMKISLKIAFLFLLGAAATGFCFEKKSEPADPQPQTSLLWKIEGNGLRQPSYLFGTMHLIQKEYFYFPASLEKIIKKSDVVVTEIALDKMGDQAEALKYIYLKEGRLLDFFNKGQQDTLLQWAQSKLMLNKEAFEASFGKMKPFVILQTVVQLNFFGKTESYEMKIKDVADKNKIPFRGFESVAEQISFFDDMTRAEQAEMVMESIRDEQKNVALMVNMQGIYNRQQLDSLHYLIQEEGGAIAKRESTFLNERNKRWIPQIKEIMNHQKAFIAVGAGHLSGDEGVIRLLREEGYTVTPIAF
ncbi:MAG: TraB/GumN family protein [Bacteroidota bacterium]